MLRAVCRPGATIASAAHDLGISPHTARNHLRSLYRLLGVNTAAQATYVLWADSADVPLPFDESAPHHVSS